MKKIRLTQGKTTIVDDADYDYLRKFQWYAYKNGLCWYAGRTIYPNGTNKHGKILQMHVAIMGKRKGKEIDHRNRNGLDNQRQNLRFLTHAKNCANRRKRKGTSSKYIGVSWNKKYGSWQAYIKVKGKLIHLGLCPSEEVAHIIRLRAESEYGYN